MAHGPKLRVNRALLEDRSYWAILSPETFGIPGDLVDDPQAVTLGSEAGEIRSDLAAAAGEQHGGTSFGHLLPPSEGCIPD